MKEIYDIDMKKTQHPKLINDIPDVDIAISMGCNVGCPYIGKEFDDNWMLDDPSGKNDEEFIKVIFECLSWLIRNKQIEIKIKELKERLNNE